MTRKKTRIVKELEPEEVEGYSQAQIEHYLSLGYRPYLDERSHIKWLTGAQYSLRGAHHVHVPVTRRLIHPRHSGRYRKKRGHRSLYRFFREYWFFILLVVVLGVFLILVFFYPNLLF
ncbi:MAG: hypothetical protein PWP64_402 [Candidatus Cloacimonadota bacterium]|nr:hypothetical protein [Candidatus Cloacimonadota bacterium]